MRRALALAVALVAWPSTTFGGHGGVPPLVTQPITFASATLTDAELLTGAAGTPVSIGGQLRLPVTPARIPAVILVHGETGVAANVRHWADVLSSIGLAVFLLDSFSGRGIAETSTDVGRLSDASMLVDAYRALGVVAAHGKIDGRHIAILGFSKGGWAALHPKGVEFAAHLALYPPCTATYRDDAQVSARPIRVFHGTVDDWMPIEPCRQYLARLQRAGADAALVELPGARYFFDVADLPAMLRLPAVQRRSCALEERAPGLLATRATGRPPAREECVQVGVTVGHDARAYEDTLRRVKETLVSALGGG